MKELSIEEKAKRYDEAIAHAKLLLKTIGNATLGNLVLKNEFENMFPELKESEDENIRKELMEQVVYIVPDKNETDNEGNVLPSYQKRIDKYIAWLERQQKPNPYSGTSFEYNGHTWGMCARDNGVEILIDGHIKSRVFIDDSNAKEMFIKALERVEEQNAKGYKLTDCDKNSWWEDFKAYTTSEQILSNSSNIGKVEQESVDKIEPKFKVGDWVFIEEVKGYKQGAFQIKSIDEFGYNFDEYHIIPFMYEELLSKWTIQEAKAGDVLTASDDSIFLFAGVVDYACKHYVALTTDGVITFNEGLKYSWETSRAVQPASKEQRDTLMKAMADAGYTFDFEKKELKKIEQKHTPKHKVGDTIYYNSFGEVKSMIVANVVTDSTDNPMYEDENGNAVFEKELIEQNPAWSEEDGEIVEALNDYVKNLDILFSEIKIGDKDILSKEFREKVQPWLKSLKDRVQPKQEILEKLEEWLDEYVSDLASVDTATLICSFINYLDGKLLKSLRPQSRWKPSEEQLGALYDSIKHNLHLHPVLKSLYNDLKKLREE